MGGEHFSDGDHLWANNGGNWNGLKKPVSLYIGEQYTRFVKRYDPGPDDTAANRTDFVRDKNGNKRLLKP